MLDTDDRLHLLGLVPETLVQALAARGFPCTEPEARRVLCRVISDGADDPVPQRIPVRKALIEHLLANARWDRPVVEERVEDPDDGSVRYLFRAADGARFMGQGEPFHNYDEVIRAAKVLSHPAGGRIAQEAVTISTVGLVNQIRRYTREGHDYKLIVSLTSARAELRRELLPVAGKIPFAELIEALREHADALKARSKAESVGQRLTIAWVLMGGVNDGPEEVEALRELLGDLPVRINLIDVNDARPDGFRRSTEDERRAFQAGLRTLGVPVVRRYSVGRSRHSACGMLASRKLAEIEGA